MDFNRLRRFSKLKKKKEELKKKLKEVESGMKELEEQLLEDFTRAGVDKMSLDGKTFYLTSRIFVSPKKKDTEDTTMAYERVCEGLRDMGLDWMVTERFNVNTISAYVRELKRNEESLPEGFEELMNISETFKVGIRNS